LILSGNLATDCRRIAEAINDSERYEYLCKNAYKTAQGLTIQKWCEQMKFALLDKAR